MRNLIYLIIRYSAFFVFVILEFVAFYLVVQNNTSQSEIWKHSTNIVVGGLADQSQYVEDFFGLRNQNDSLLRENAKLLETIINYRVANEFVIPIEDIELDKDTSNQFTLIPAKVCARNIHLRNNNLVLCKGSDHGIEPGMGVISSGGVVGIIKSVSNQFSTVIMIIHNQSRISAKIEGKEYHGNLKWVADDVRKLNLFDVPKHAEIEIGDLIVSSGYSISFPPGINIGKVSSFEVLSGSNNYNISVGLDYDLCQVDNVYIIKYQKKQEKSDVLSNINE